MTTPWWEGKQYAQLGTLNQRLDDDWASQALAEQALKQGLTLFENGLDGNANMLFEDVSAKIQALGLRIVYDIPMWRNDRTQRRCLVRHDAMVILYGVNEIGGEMGARIATTDAALFASMKELLELAIGPKGSNGKIYVLTAQGEDGIKLKNLGMAAVPLDRGNYNPEVLQDFDAVVADLRSQEPSGRLAIFDGVPGTGKTFMMKGLLAAVPEALFVLVPVGLVPELGNPTFIGSLIEMRRDKDEDVPTVLVIEDADKCLGSRDDSNVNEVSALLNLSDGIIGALMDLRMVCSTNLRDDELDEAVIREGRLSRKVSMGALEQGVAETLFERLTGEKVRIEEKLTLAQVYTRARDSGWKPVVKKRSIGFGT